MTLSMPDAVDVAALPDGYGQYLGYIDGNLIKPTMPALRARFPRARLIGLTTTGQTLDADGIDCEPGNVNAAETAAWIGRKLDDEPGFRPVIYASVHGEQGFGMGDILAVLSWDAIALARVRLLSAHYGRGEHICGPATCGEIAIPMDGTQWTDRFPSGPRLVDMSALVDSFFGSWTEEIMRELPVVRQGDTGAQVRTVQGLCDARLAGRQMMAIDGIFGPVTAAAVRLVQSNAHIAQDGVVGPQTWPVLLGIA